MRLCSGFAILDVKRGRVGLAEALEYGPVEVVIHGRITAVYSGDDGESVEFSVDVDRVEALDGPDA